MDVIWRRKKNWIGHILRGDRGSADRKKTKVKKTIMYAK